MKENRSAFPSYMLIELSSRCNLKCEMCAINEDPRLQKGGEWYGDVNPLVIENLKETLPHIQRIDLNGHGEALMNKHFIQILKEVKGFVPFVGITSNALMIKEKTAAEMVRNGLSEIIISIHAVDPELYAEISRPGTFKAFISALCTLIRAKEAVSSSLPVIKFQFVGMKKNVAELIKVVELAKEYGIKDISVLPLIEHSLVKGQSLLDAPELVRKYFPPARKLAEEYGIHLNFATNYTEILDKTEGGDAVSVTDALSRLFKKVKKVLRPFKRLLTGKNPFGYPSEVRIPSAEEGDDNNREEQPARDCLDPWRFSYVLQSGRVRPCCVMEDNMGNLLEKTFTEIWNGKAYQSLRRRILEGEQPEQCRNCPIRPVIPLSVLHEKVKELQHR